LVVELPLPAFARRCSNGQRSGLAIDIGDVWLLSFMIFACRFYFVRVRSVEEVQNGNARRDACAFGTPLSRCSEQR